MKKIISIVLSICAVLALCVPYSNFVSALSLKAENEIIAEISKAIGDFYYQKDVSGKTRSNGMTSSDVEAFLFDKIETHQYVINLYGTQKENYKANVELLNKSTDSGIMQLEYKVDTTYNYVGCETESLLRTTVFIKYDIASEKIIDWFDPFDYYDAFVRNAENEQSFRENNNAFRANAEIKNNQNSIIDSIDNVFTIESSNALNNSQRIPERRGTSLNHQAGVAWALNNCEKANPSSGNGTVPYYDFSEISGNWDCTNFVSHALLASGANIYDTGNSGISASGWYYRSLSNRSSSWSGVNPFYNYMSTSTASNKATAKDFVFMYSLNGAYWGIGSILQFDYEGDLSYDHSTIISTKERSADGDRCYARVTGRTSDGRCQSDVAVSEISPTGLKRVLNVYNYY